MNRIRDFDFYRSNKDTSLRLAVPYGAPLPPPFDPNDWNVMYATPSEEGLLAEVVADVDKRGFSFYRLT